MPNIDAIKAYYAAQGKDVQYIFPWALFDQSWKIAWYARDGGKNVSMEVNYDPKANKGLLLIKSGKITLSHTSEQAKLPSWYDDIAMMTSIKRDERINEGQIFDGVGHYIVKKTDGSVEIVVLAGDKATKIARIKSESTWERMLHLDVKGSNGNLQGYRVNKNGTLVYGNHDTGDILLWTSTSSPAVVSGQMPSLFVITKDNGTWSIPSPKPNTSSTPTIPQNWNNGENPKPIEKPQTKPSVESSGGAWVVTLEKANPSDKKAIEAFNKIVISKNRSPIKWYKKTVDGIGKGNDPVYLKIKEDGSISIYRNVEWQPLAEKISDYSLDGKNGILTATKKTGSKVSPVPVVTAPVENW
jgi:hypothetical protein